MQPNRDLPICFIILYSETFEACEIPVPPYRSYSVLHDRSAWLLQAKQHPAQSGKRHQFLLKTMVPDTINILSGILAEMGDISRFDDVKEIQKLSGLGLVACSSGKHKGETKISHRGRKRLRYWLFQAAKSAVAHAEEVKELHVYYTTRPDNPLKKMQSLIVIACKLLRIVYTILKKGTVYDPKKMLMDIRRPEKKEAIAA